MSPQANSKPGIQDVGYNSQDEIGHTIHQARTTGAVSISAELFEKLYLAPKTEVSGQLRRTFGNPTPMYDSPAISPVPAVIVFRLPKADG